MSHSLQSTLCLLCAEPVSTPLPLCQSCSEAIPSDAVIRVREGAVRFREWAAKLEEAAEYFESITPEEWQERVKNFRTFYSDEFLH